MDSNTFCCFLSTAAYEVPILFVALAKLLFESTAFIYYLFVDKVVLQYIDVFFGLQKNPNSIALNWIPNQLRVWLIWWITCELGEKKTKRNSSSASPLTLNLILIFYYFCWLMINNVIKDVRLSCVRRDIPHSYICIAPARVCCRYIRIFSMRRKQK